MTLSGAVVAYILLGIGTVLVIYFYAVTATAESGDRKRREKDYEDGSGRGRNPSPIKRKPRIRRCPICSSEMGVSDKLYAEVYKATPRDKVFIKGCPKCHALPGKPESKPDFLKEVEL